MDFTSSRVRLLSKFILCAHIYLPCSESDVIPTPRERLPSWMTDEEGQKSQMRAWDVVAAELEAIEPGCLKKLVELQQ
jgi:hypothetical protein